MAISREPIERTIRLGTLTRVLQRAEVLEGNEKIVDLEFDEQIDLVTLYLVKEG